jgi:hypothetical protein
VLNQRVHRTHIEAFFGFAGVLDSAATMTSFVDVVTEASFSLEVGKPGEMSEGDLGSLLQGNCNSSGSSVPFSGSTGVWENLLGPPDIMKDKYRCRQLEEY